MSEITLLRIGVMILSVSVLLLSIALFLGYSKKNKTP